MLVDKSFWQLFCKVFSNDYATNLSNEFDKIDVIILLVQPIYVVPIQKYQYDA